MPKDRLTDKQEGFARSIAHDGMNQSDAYRANYDCSNMVDTTVWNNAYMLVNDSEVAARILEFQTAIQAQLDVTQEQIVGELRGIAFGNVADLMSWGPDGVTLKASDDLPREITALVSEVSETTTKDGGSIKLKVHDKQSALKEIAKLGGMYPKEESVPMDTALGAIIKLAGALSEAELRGLAAGRGPVVEGESHEV